MYSSEIGDASTWLEFESTWRTPTKKFVSICSLSLPSFTSSRIIHEKIAKWTIPTLESPSVFRHKIELDFEKYQSESSPSMIFNGSHLVKAYSNSFQQYIVQNGPFFAPISFYEVIFFPWNQPEKWWRLCIATAPATTATASKCEWWQLNATRAELNWSEREFWRARKTSLSKTKKRKRIGVMPPKKRPKHTNDKSVKTNEAWGSGSQSRIGLDFEKLREAGWMSKQEERESSSGLKVYFRYSNPGGKTEKF